MDTPPILVIMPLYNARSYVRQAVDSILTQTYPHFCLLVIDDGSTDGSEDIVNQIKDTRVLLQHQENSGPGVAMNQGIGYAQEHEFKYIARMDADDISMPERLEKQISLLNNSPQAAVCSSNCYWIDSDTEKIIGTSTVPRKPSVIKWEIRNGLRGLIQGACLFRAEALSAIGGYRRQFITSEETDLFLRLSERFSMANSPEFLYKIRLCYNSLSMQNVERTILYTHYALDCAERRKHGKNEETFDGFLQSMGFLTQYRIWREKLFLQTWRRSMYRKNPFLLLMAGMIDPRRVVSRLIRMAETRKG